MSYIYKITNDLNSKVYIGQTRGGLESRLKEHLYDARVGKDNSKFHSAIRELGENHFSISLVEECETSQLNERERYWIKFFNSQNNGYNSTRGGQNDPYYTDVDIAIDYYLSNRDSKTLTKITKDLRIQPNRLRDLLEERGVRDKQAYCLYEEITQEEKDCICQEYLSKVSVSTLATKYHHDFDTVKKILTERQIYVNHRSKPIDQFALDGTFIKSWPTLAAAVREYGNKHIGECAKGKRKTAAGYIWKYGADNLDSIGD